MSVIFFDIGDTLASPIFSADNRLQGFNVFPEARTALEFLKSRQLEIGVISNIGDEAPENVNNALRDCHIYEFLNPRYIIYKKKDSPQAFAEAAYEAGVMPDKCVFVGENSQERAFALAAGFLRVVPHPALIEEAIDGTALVYLRLTLNAGQINQWSEIKESVNLVPLKISGRQNKSIYAIAGLKTLDILNEKQFGVEVLGGRDAPLKTDLYLVRDDRPVSVGFAAKEDFSVGFLAEEGRQNLIVANSEEGLFLAIPSDQSIDDIHFPDSQHGHNEKLIADFSLYNQLWESERELKKNEFLSFAFTAPASFESSLLSESAKAELAKINADVLRKHHQTYAGLAPFGNGHTLVSRHIRHIDNQLAVDALQTDLKQIGGVDIHVSTHRFQHENLSLFNVIAEYSGGEEPDAFVLITAHLDSTAASNPGIFRPATDAAPGADDDASGIAAVLAIVGAFGALYKLGKPKKSVRFVLFNAEEQGLIGSKAYARSQAALQSRIVAVFQMDMIGFLGNQEVGLRRFEVHAGFDGSEDIENRSLALAQILNQVFPIVSPSLKVQQTYPDFESGDGTDPAAGRSDHAPFNERGYAAVVVSEDFFAGPKPDSPSAQPNPNYHRSTDKEINYEYAADIARAIAAAALYVANT